MRDEIKKNELTDKLMGVENDIHQAKIELRSINARLELAYEYENTLEARIIKAREITGTVKEEFFKKSGEISNLYDTMKSIFAVFTGNHHQHG